MTMPAGPSLSLPQLFDIFTHNPFPFLQDCFDTYGDLFTLPLGTFGVGSHAASGQWVFMSRPEHLKILFNADPGGFLAGAANDIQFQQLLPSAGSVVIDGPQHIERRRILGKLVQGERHIRKFTHAISALVIEEAARFPIGEIFSLTPCLRRISNRVMQQLTFGELQDGDTGYVKARLSEFGDPGLSHQDRVDMINDCCAVLDGKIDRDKKCPHADADNIFSLLLKTQNAEGRLSDEQIRAELIVILLGGTDTTTSSMAWVAAWILSNRTIYERVREELHRVFGDDHPDGDAIDQLVFLDVVIKESCRISPLLFNSSARLLTQPMQLDQHTLPAGTIAASCSYLAHTRPDNYPQPLQFRPERFIDARPDPYRWVPFGGGIRRCLGMAFALYEMKVVIATLMHCAHLIPVEVSTQPELQGSFFAPAGGVRVRVDQR